MNEGLRERRKKIVIIGQFIEENVTGSNSRFAYLAELFSVEYDTHLLTSSFYHSGKRQKEESPSTGSYRLGYIYEPGYRKNVSLRRLYSHKVFGKSLRKKLKELGNIDLIYCAIPSIDAAWESLKYAKDNSVPFVLDIQDLWPEAFQMVIPNEKLSGILFSFMRNKVNYIYEMADYVVAVSETYINRANSCRESNEGAAVYLGTDKTTFDVLLKENQPFKAAGEFWVTYVGTLGHSYDIQVVIDAMHLLKERNYNNIAFHIIGDGPLKERFMNYAVSKNVNVIFHGRLSYPKAVGYLGVSDVAVNPIVPKSPASIINKHGDYAMAGLPVVSTQTSTEYTDLLATYKAGINCDGRNPKSIADAIEGYYTNKELLGEHRKNSRHMGEELFDRGKTYYEIVRKIENVLRDSPEF